MKKLITIAIAVLTAISLNAQGDHDRQNYLASDTPVFRVVSIICVIALFMLFILIVMKRVFEYRLKNKVIDKGISENIISSILQKNDGEDRHINIKWFALLTGLGAGLTIIYYTQPLGIHSLAIIAFSIALSFLGYFFYLKYFGN
ncbi:MAG: hypothetical protein Q8941_13890 [Bacteroidota bacterium]|nr:hypothetical protein [Bacteroidota bacterium]